MSQAQQQNATFNQLPTEILETMLAEVDESPTECDGCSRLVSHNLCLLGVAHKIMVGSVIIRDAEAFFPDEERELDPHFWVELHRDRGVMWRIDYRLSCYLETYGIAAKMPHGLFLQGLNHHPGVIYDSNSEMPGCLLPATVYKILQSPETIPGLTCAIQELQSRITAINWINLHGEEAETTA